jgi:hypothetical protein
MCRARDAGFGQNYHPAIVQLVDGRVASPGSQPRVTEPD